MEEFVKQPAGPGQPPAGLAELTGREREVLIAVAHGLSNQEIAHSLYISYPTTKTHVSHLLTKLRARDRAQLVMIAYESGLIPPAPSR